MSINKISVITVVYNDCKHIEETIKSFISQTWRNKEYIIIDGGSTDGTVDIIKRFEEYITFWCSEPDEGIYDAMNKGIAKASGDWINILNSGDHYASTTSLEDAVRNTGTDKVDVIFGDSIEIHKHFLYNKYADNDLSKLEYAPTFRHGSALIKASVHKANKFDLSKKKQLNYALDWDMLYKLYKTGHVFHKVNVFIEAYQIEGVSNRPYKNLWLNYKVTTQYGGKVRKSLFLLKSIIMTLKRRSSLWSYFTQFVLEYIVNSVCPHIPFWTIRKQMLKLSRTRIGHESFIMRKCYIMQANKLSIGEYSHINRECLLDARGGITIGNNVSISHKVNIVSGSHDAQSKTFIGVFKPIVINDYAWLGIGCTILQGVNIGKGAVIAAGSVVTKDIAPFDIVAGIPARKIGTRNSDLEYHCNGWLPFT